MWFRDFSHLLFMSLHFLISENLEITSLCQPGDIWRIICEGESLCYQSLTPPGKATSWFFHPSVLDPFSVEVATPAFWDLTPRQSWTRQSPDANPKALENPKFTQKRFFLITPSWSFIVTSTQSLPGVIPPYTCELSRNLTTLKSQEQGGKSGSQGRRTGPQPILIISILGFFHSL